MRTCRVKAYAKVNLFLDIVGTNNGYHDLDTVVVTVNVFDNVSVTRRKDDKIVLKTGGGLYFVCDNEDNNAYKAAKAFCDAFNTNGVDISISKNIPVGSGLGGSSADIAGVLKAMKKLYGIEEDIKPLADSLGSDSGYLLTGGYARLLGRGDKVEPLDIDKKLYILVAPSKGGCNTRECFKEYDSSPLSPVEGGADRLIENLKSNKVVGSDFYNALYPAACRVNDRILSVYELIASLSPSAAFMSGSGSSVCAIFETPELCYWALEKVRKLSRYAFVTETLSSGELKPLPFFRRSLYSLTDADDD